MQFKLKTFFPIGAFYPSQIGEPCNTLYWHIYELNKHSVKIDVVTTTIGIKKGLVKKMFHLIMNVELYFIGKEMEEA
jgi:hypothetical protein